MNTPVFRTGGQILGVADVLDAAHFRGELEPAWKEVLWLAECEARAGEEPEAAALQASSEKFRSDRDLITAEETEQWLEERGLTLDDFTDYFVRHYWKEALVGNAEPPALDYLDAPQNLRDLLRAELLINGEFDRQARQLAWRFAARSAQPAREAIARERARFLERTRLDEATLPAWLARLGRDESWLEEMLQLEAAYRQQSSSLLTTEALEGALELLRIPLTRIKLEIIELEALHAAREAFLCLREDGASMQEVARDGRYPCRRVEVLLEELPAESQQKFLSAAAGEVLEPLARGEGFQLCQLIQKIEPELTDVKVRARAEQHVLNRHFSELVAEHVRWIMPPTYDAAAR
ncbi:MAG: hypothetical protein QOE70_1758 [Chthoniobacter sp.]|jgi:hypothetical protein|nr:hypothetical protein [Chthoniobacter sp.]